MVFIDMMHKETVRVISTIYEDNPPAILGQDQSTPAELIAAMRKLGRQWEKRFEDLGKTFGRKTTKESAAYADRAFKNSLSKAGFTIEFKQTKEVAETLTAQIAENVALIKSIPQEYHTQVEGLVMRSVTQGRKLSELKAELQKRYGITSRKATTIARDQNNKATAGMVRVRQTALGITQARWLHSAGARHPRPEHVAFSAGTHKGAVPGPYYDVKKGAFLEGKWVWPGTEINCGCVSVSVIPGLALPE